MHLTLVISTFLLAVVAAARSTWSPCGLSMLSSITPIGERGRSHRFGATAAWYVVGALLGGATLGAVMLLLALGVHTAAPATTPLVAVGALAALGGAAADLGLLGFQLPLLRRQVNEVWLDRYRGWVYGAGFGWQIGVGFTTYVMTAAVVVIVVLAALTGDPLLALGVGLTFGAARGLTVLTNRTITDADALRAAHRRYAAWRRPVWVAVVTTQLAVAGALGATLWLPSPVVLAAASLAVLVVVRPARLAGRAGEARA
jgi:MFS family permease